MFRGAKQFHFNQILSFVLFVFQIFNLFCLEYDLRLNENTIFRGHATIRNGRSGIQTSTCFSTSDRFGVEILGQMLYGWIYAIKIQIHFSNFTGEQVS